MIRNILTITLIFITLFGISSCAVRNPQTVLNEDSQDVEEAQQEISQQAETDIPRLRLKYVSKYLPVIAGKYTTGGNVADVFVEDNIMYIADLDRGLVIMDISNLDKPRYMAHMKFLGHEQAVYIEENKAYVADEYGGLVIVDVQDPENPRKLGEITIRDENDVYTQNVRDVCVIGKYAYILVDFVGLMIFDVSDPKNPKLIKTIDIEGSQLECKREFLYTGGNVIDISIPDDPKIVSTVDGEILDIDFDRKLMYVFWYKDIYHEALKIFKIDDVGNPVEIFSDDIGYILSAKHEGDYLYVLSGEGIAVINVSDPKNPQSLGSTKLSMNVGAAWNMYIEGNHIYIPAFSDGLIVVDISNREDPEELFHIVTGGRIGGFQIDGNILYAAGMYSGLLIMNIENKEAIEPLSSLYFREEITKLYITDNKAFLANVDGSAGNLIIVDVSDKSSPSIVSTLKTNDWVMDVYVKDDYAYLANRNHGMLVVDISDPKKPNIYSQVTINYARAIDIKGDYAFIAADVNGVAVVNISDPKNPKVVKKIDTDGISEDVVVSMTGYVYVADEWNGLIVIDASDPDNSRVVNHLGYDSLHSQIYSLYLDGRYLYLGTSDGVTICDVSIPSSPVVVGELIMDDLLSYGVESILVSDDYVYVGSAASGIFIFKIEKGK